MPSNYPTGLDAFTTGTLTGVVAGADHGNKADAINKVEAELGVSPSGTAATVAARLANLPVSVKDHGAVGDGTTNDTSAIQSAIAAAGAYGVVLFPSATYLADELDQANNGQVWQMAGVTLKARTNGINMIHWSASNGGIQGHPKLDANAKTTVSGLRVTPADESQTSTRVDQNFNDFYVGEINSCAEAIVMKAGPRVTGADSGCWYNRFHSVHAVFCTRGLWMKDPTTNPGSGVNRNKFYGCRFGQTGMNTGVQIDAGSTNSFHGVDFEGIATGTSPNATPTAIKIVAAGVGAGNNDSNIFHGSMFEANTRDVENDNSYTQFYGHTIGSGKRTGTQVPVMVSTDTSAQPLVLPGMRYPEGSLAGFESNWNILKAISVLGLTGTGYFEGYEQSTSFAPLANGYRIFGRDNGSGKTQLCVQFNTGAVQVLATEP